MLEQMTRMERERRLQQVLERNQAAIPEQQAQQDQQHGDAQPLVTFTPRHVPSVKTTLASLLGARADVGVLRLPHKSPAVSS
jgi:hypothetical protein